MIRIAVKCLEFFTYEFYIEPSDSVDSLKQKLKDKDGYPLEVQRLIYSGKELKNGTALSDYDVKDGSTIYFIFIKSDSKEK